MLDQRSSSLLSLLVHAESYVPAKELTEKFNISRRTVYYDIDKINSWLKENELGPVKHIRGTGFILDKRTKALIPEKMDMAQTWHYEYSLKERKSLLALYLLGRDTPMYLEDLLQRTKVSRNTTIEDLKVLKEELLRFSISLEFERKAGYIINGKEEDKRKAIVYYLSTLLPNEGWNTLVSKLPAIINSFNQSTNLFNETELEAIQEIIKEIEKDLNIQFTDDFHQQLTFRLILFGKRLTQGKKIIIGDVEKEVLSQTKEYQAVSKLSEQLSKVFQLDFPQDEKYYLTKHLLSSRVQFADDTPTDSGVQEVHILSEVVSSMVTDFQRYACIFIKDRQELEKNLLLHVKPSYYRIKYELEVESGIAELVKTKYHDIFLLTQKVIHHLEKAVGKSVNENEIALLAMHFGGWMRRTGATLTARKKLLIVCTNGVGTSKLLERQLEGLLPTVDIMDSVSLREYESGDYAVDFIVSTIPLQSENTPVFLVSAILTETEKERLLQNVHPLKEWDVQPENHSLEAILSIVERNTTITDQENLKKELREYLNKLAPKAKLHALVKPNLTELLTEETIQVETGVKDWKEAIIKASQPLLDNGSITKSYIESMIDNIVKLGPYIIISPKVAIPHAKPEDGVNKLGMSLMKLVNSVCFSEDKSHEVQLVLILAAVDGDTHLKALSQLTAFLSSDWNRKAILNATTVQEICSLLESTSAEQM